MASLLKQREEDALKRFLESLQKEVAEAFEELGIIHWPGQHGNTARNAQAADRILIWLQWSRMYHVSVKRIVKLLATEYRRRLRVLDSNQSLGVSMSTITAPAAELWLAAELKTNVSSERYPHLPKKYNSLEEYAEFMFNARRRDKHARTAQKPFRGSEGWRPPETDIVRRLLA